MSVAILGVEELGRFAAISVKLKLRSLADACQTMETISISNCAAYYSQYSEFEPHHSADDIEAQALRLLASPTGLQGRFGPFVYNCIDNGGTMFYGQLSFNRDNPPTGAILAAIHELDELEKACRKFYDSECARIARQADDDAAFADVGPLPKLTAEELRTEMAKRGATRLIVARFNVDESDLHTDYFGSRTAREVVIGFGTGSRDSFPQMRKAAGQFPPTADYAPGCNDYTARVVLQNDVATTSGSSTSYYKGFRSPWHNDIGHGREFLRREEAQAFVDAAPIPHSISFNTEQTATFAWEIDFESFEHRENYSMGGGNYLGRSRYSGWKVYQTTYVSNDMEFFDAPAPIVKKTSKPKATRTPAAASVATLADHYAANV